MSFVSSRPSLRSTGTKLSNTVSRGANHWVFLLYLPTQKNCEKIVCLMLDGIQNCRSYVRVQSCCFPRELLSFDTRHVTRSPPIRIPTWESENSGRTRAGTVPLNGENLCLRCGEKDLPCVIMVTHRWKPVTHGMGRSVPCSMHGAQQSQILV